MNPYKLILDILALLSMGYGVYLVVRFLYDLKKDVKELREFRAEMLLDRSLQKLATKLGVKPESR